MSPVDWFPPNDFVYLLIDLIDMLEENGHLDVFAAQYLKKDSIDNTPYNPKMMTCILVYAYFKGIHSSRKIEEAMYYHIGFRFLANNNLLTYKTINNFRE